MAGQPKKRAKTKATEKSAALKKAAAAYAKEQKAKALEVAPEPMHEVEPEVAPVIEAEPFDDEVLVKAEVVEPAPEPAVVESGLPVMHFAVPHPGFIPDGFEITGVTGSPTVVRGFIPDADPKVAAAKAVDPSYGVCPWCDADFSSKPDPAASLKAHQRSKHK
jgi:hypothetical protein